MVRKSLPSGARASSAAGRLAAHVRIAACSKSTLGAPQRRLERSQNGSSCSWSPFAAALSSAASVAACRGSQNLHDVSAW
jgi:hypothetical protein